MRSQKTNRKFDREFKIQAVKMVLEESIPIVEVAKKLEVNQGQIHKWKKDYLDHGTQAFEKKANRNPESEEVRRLKKKLANLEEEHEILKKAVAIFSKTQD